MVRAKISGLCRSAVSAAAEVSIVGGVAGGRCSAAALGAPLICVPVLIVGWVPAVHLDCLLDGARDRFKVAVVAAVTSLRFGAAVLLAAVDPLIDLAVPIVDFVVLTIGFGLTLLGKRLLVAVVPLPGVVSLLDVVGVLPRVSLLDLRPMLGFVGSVVVVVAGDLVHCCWSWPDVWRPFSSLMGGACLGCTTTTSCSHRRLLRLLKNVVAC